MVYMSVLRTCFLGEMFVCMCVCVCVKRAVGGIACGKFRACDGPFFLGEMFVRVRVCVYLYVYICGN